MPSDSPLTPPKRKPRSRKPSSWPPIITDAIFLALRQEVLIPFESEPKVKEWRKVVNEIRRSYREHNHPDATAVNGLRVLECYTCDIIKERPQYDADPERFPYTVIISPAMGLLPNLNAAVSIPHPTPPPPITSAPAEFPKSELERELQRLIHEQIENAEDKPSAADFFRSRVK
jgi:hypothetical protein